MICEDQVFVANVVVIDPTQEMVTMSVINRPTNAAMELNAITKIHNYRRLREEHHFIPMAMEVHNAFECEMDCFIKECACLFHDRQSKGHLTFFSLHSIFEVTCKYCSSACFSLYYREEDHVGERCM
jgi:hypothetical protein